MQKIDKIDKDRYRRWVNNDITQTYFRIIEAEGIRLTNYIATGNAIPTQNSPFTLDQAYMKYVGMIEALNLMRHPDAVFEKYDFFEEDSE